MVQNTVDYYYFVLKDSNGHTNTYDNNSNLFSVFIPQIDFQAPWNTTPITITGQQLSFHTNESVNVTVICSDSAELNNFTCASQSAFGQIFSLSLQVPISGTAYLLREVIIIDKAGNSTTIALDMPFQT